MATFEEVLLYDSIVCRLCAAENADGIFMYDTDNEFDFRTLINKYLPLKVEDDGKLPRTICPGCNIQLESTIQFFDLLVEGQKKIRDLYKLQTVNKKKLDREKQMLVETLKGNPKISLVTEVDSIQDDDIFIRILPDGNFFGSEHEMTLKIHGLEKPKRKRGRPKKQKPEEDLGQSMEQLPTEEVEDINKNDANEEQEDELDEHGRKRRRRKVPQRFMEAVQGKELDKLLRAEGAIDGNDSDETISDHEPATGEEMLGELAADPLQPGVVIGHLETPDGNIAEQIIAPSVGRGLNKKKKLIRYFCDFCDVTFKDRARWSRHRQTHRGMKLICMQQYCQKRFSGKNKLRLHQKMAGHEGQGIVEDEVENFKSKKTVKPRHGCLHCIKTFASAPLLSKHVAAEHPEALVIDEIKNEISETKIDGTGEEGIDILENSIEDQKDDVKAKSRLGKLHSCDECDRTFNHPSSLMYHKESVHNDGRRFVCSKCNKSFTHKQLLQRHQMVHSDMRPFPCPDCGLRFKTKSNLFNHRVVHTGEKKFTCPQCGQQFAHKTSLTLHLRWHKGHRPFKCHVCQKCFTQNGNLREHLRIHTNTKPYSCEYCGKRFTTSSQHKLHVKRHTGDRPWKCSHCDRSFLHKDTWRTHERRHTGEKPYQCSYCMRGFAEHWSLKKHVRLHTGEKPYKCLFCGKDFADCSNLTKHRKVHLSSTGGFPTATNIDGALWGVLGSQMEGDIPQQTSSEDVQQIIYVAYQDSSNGKVLQIVDSVQDSAGQEVQYGTEKEIGALTMVPEMKEDGEEDGDADDSKTEVAVVQSHLGVTDEEGNTVQLTIDGRTVDLVSMDTESDVIQVRTSDGQEVFVHLPKNQEIAEDDLMARIQQAVDELHRTKYKSVLLPREARDTETIERSVLTEGMLTGAEIIDGVGERIAVEEDDKPLGTDFEMDDTYKKLHDLLSTEEC